MTLESTLFSVFSIFIALLLLITGFLKTLNLRKFYLIAIQYGVLPRKLMKPFAYSLPFVEMLVGLAILLRFETLIFSIIALLLLTSSNIGILNVLIKEKKLKDCGCYGGIIKVPVTWKKFYENLIYIGMVVYMIIILL